MKREEKQKQNIAAEAFAGWMVDLVRKGETYRREKRNLRKRLLSKDFALTGQILAEQLVIENQVEKALLLGGMTQSQIDAQWRFKSKINLLKKGQHLLTEIKPQLYAIANLRNDLAHNLHFRVTKKAIEPLYVLLRRFHRKDMRSKKTPLEAIEFLTDYCLMTIHHKKTPEEWFRTVYTYSFKRRGVVARKKLREIETSLAEGKRSKSSS